jgi:hypothetical protein
MKQGTIGARRLVVVLKGRMLVPVPIVVERSGASVGVAPPQLIVLGVTGELFVEIVVWTPLSSMVYSRPDYRAMTFAWEGRRAGSKLPRRRRRRWWRRRSCRRKQVLIEPPSAFGCRVEDYGMGRCPPCLEAV